MKIIIDFDDFKPWSGGKETWDHLSESEREQLESHLDDMFPEGTMTDTQLNDFLWFDTDTIAELLGYRNGEAFWERDEDSWEEHYKSVLTKEYHYVDEDIIDSFIDDEATDGESDTCIIEKFDEWWKSDDPCGRASVLLSRRFDDDEDIIENFAEEMWDEDLSDEENFKAFEEYRESL